MIDSCHRHSSVCLDNMRLTDPDMIIITQQVIVKQSVQVLSLQSNCITCAGVSIIAESLINNNSLEALYLGRNHISDDGASCLAHALSNNTCTLQILVLQNNHITDRGVNYLAQMLQCNTTLTWLYLGGNHISDEGVRMLVDVLTNGNTTLQLLTLSSNKRLTHKSVKYLLSLVEHSQSLRKLWIDDCDLSSESKMALLEIQQTKRDLYIQV
jgi:Ran GTPase-activating protein (RanGAP) involved in mRNA processing and transport